jgi:hypothetical protein
LQIKDTIDYAACDQRPEGEQAVRTSGPFIFFLSVLIAFSAASRGRFLPASLDIAPLKTTAAETGSRNYMMYRTDLAHSTSLRCNRLSLTVTSYVSQSLKPTTLLLQAAWALTVPG